MSLSITNKEVTGIGVNLSIVTPGGDILITPIDMQLAAGDSYFDKNIVLKQNYQIKIVTTGSAAYYLSFQIDV
jgi:hypothetical protein